jgi:hypothetical protein
MLTWQTRLVRADWRSEQTSNAYVLMVQEALPLPGRSSGGQSVRETLQRFNLDDAAARENAVRQLIALGESVPAAWQ